MPLCSHVPDGAADISLSPVNKATLRHGSTPRIVLDTNACLDLFLFVSARSARLRQLLETGALQAVSRPDCRDEWHRVLRYPELGLSAERCSALESRYDVMVPAVYADATRHGPVPRCRDPDDQKFLELARDAGAVALVTRDAELLALARRAARAGLFHIVEPVDIDRIFEVPLGGAMRMA
jgi:predicted nucleic acid-binding protein